MANHQKCHQNHHFLLVTISAQGQLTPARRLAARLVNNAGVRVTIATPISCHRLLFPTDEIIDDGLVSYASYSDGFDEGFHPDDGDVGYFMTKLKLVGTQTLSMLTRSLADHGRPVTCVIYTLLTEWAADVARGLGVTSHLFWVQPAAVFSIFYHYFNDGYAETIKAHRNDPSFTLILPGLPEFEMKDLPSMLTGEIDDHSLDIYRNVMEELLKEKERSGGSKPRVLMNTFYALEAEAIKAITGLNLMPVGLLMDTTAAKRDLLERDTSNYMEWLDTKEPKSVVYVSFGSYARFSTAQMEEIFSGLKKNQRPYLWVVRKDVREKESALIDMLTKDDEGNKGMVIEWCDQVSVLSHGSVGCFVTHCGWNSISESIICGVPTVMLPKWLDQKTNAKLVEKGWGGGIRAELNDDGVMEGRELRRCLDLVMGEGEMGDGIRERVELWKEKAREAVEEDGPSVQSLVRFLNDL